VTNNWTRIGIRDLLALELDLFDDTVRPRIGLDGENIDLPSDLALSLGMAFHELTINAVKYGSLSARAGSLDVSWALDTTNGGRLLRLLWRERGGPPVAAPRRRGFGTLLIDKLFTTQTGARVDMKFRSKGLEAKFEISLPIDMVRGNGRAALLPDPVAEVGRVSTVAPPTPEARVAADSISSGSGRETPSA
jgi:two-component sensor histidine kinase